MDALPGLPTIPLARPAKTAAGYLQWLANLPLEDGYQFWALAARLPHVDADHSAAVAATEWVYLLRDGQLHRALIRVDPPSLGVVVWIGDA